MSDAQKSTPSKSGLKTVIGGIGKNLPAHFNPLAFPDRLSQHYFFVWEQKISESRTGRLGVGGKGPISIF